MGKNNNQIYVIGHINPDTDSIAAAMGYAWLLQETAGGENYVAARAGQLNPQTTWVFQRLKLEPPSQIHIISRDQIGVKTAYLD